MAPTAINIRSLQLTLQKYLYGVILVASKQAKNKSKNKDRSGHIVQPIRSILIALVHGPLTNHA